MLPDIGLPQCSVAGSEALVHMLLIWSSGAKDVLKYTLKSYRECQTILGDFIVNKSSLMKKIFHCYYKKFL